MEVEIADAFADDGFAGDEDAAVIEDAAVALDVDFASPAERLHESASSAFYGKLLGSEFH